MANREERDSLHGSVGAILLGAGGSRRMGGIDKTFEPVGGRPLISYSLDVLQQCSQIDEVVLVLESHNLERGAELVRAGPWNKVARVCLGGPRRQDSVRLGLECLSPLKWVLVHDGARPCLEEDVVLRGLLAVKETGAAVSAVPVKDTVKIADSANVVKDTPSRDSLWGAQTPQIFSRELLIEAHATVQDDVTDDSSMVERLGRKVTLFMGSYDNIKVTTPRDIALAEIIITERGG